MKLIISIILAFSVMLSAFAAEESAPTIEASAAHRKAVVTAKSLMVFEGLPHQMWESDSLATEIKRKDTKKIWEFPFYTPSVEAKKPDDLRKLLSSPKSIAVYGGPKACGGYHPDFCLSWDSDGVTYYALVCFGCHEIVFYDGKRPLIYDLADDALESYKKLLSAHTSKRPKPAK